MESGDPDEPSREELVERIDQLEAKQAEQREWWQDALPSRRGVLTAGAGLGLGALLTGSASGQSAAGQVGTPSSPEDAYLADAAVSSELSIPTYDDLPDSPDNSDGTPIARASGAGTNAEGVYHWDGSQWVQGNGNGGGGGSGSLVATSGSYNVSAIQTISPTIRPSDIDVGFADPNPKEPASFYHQGSETFFLAVGVWDAYTSPSDKEVALFKSDNPYSAYTQISQVTSNTGVYMHAPSIVIDDNDELWLFYSDKSGGQNDIHAKHQPIGSIGTNPSDWTDEGEVIANRRDPGIVRDSDGTFIMYYTEPVSGNDVASFSTSTDLLNWGSEVSNVYQESNGPVEGIDAIPKQDNSGDYWMAWAGSNTSGERVLKAATASSLTATSWSNELTYGSPGSVNGYNGPWFSSDFASHPDYCRTNYGKDILYFGDELVGYFEAGSGSAFTTGYIGTQTPLNGDSSDPGNTTTLASLESGDLSSYDGDTGVFNVVQSPVKDGSYALEGTTSASGMIVKSSTSVSQGDALRMHINYQITGSGQNVGALFAAQSGSGISSISTYDVQVTGAGDKLRLARWDDGTYNNLVESTNNSQLPTNEWAYVDVLWSSDGNVTVELYDASQSLHASVGPYDTTADTTTYTSGSIGFHNAAPGGSPKYMDHYLLTDRTV